MNREIKFRAWDSENNHWYDWESGGLDYKKEGDKYVGTFNDFSEHMKIMQYTGLKDKNGKEIYDKDRLRHDNGAVLEVYWSEKDWGWSMKQIENWNPKTVSDTEQMEVIGNVYE